MKNRSAKPGSRRNRGLAVPMLFCLAVLLACRVQLSPASGWFTAKTELGLSSALHANLGASGGGFAASLSGPVWEKPVMRAGDMQSLFRDISEQDFTPAQSRTLGFSAQSPDAGADAFAAAGVFRLHYICPDPDSGSSLPDAYVRFRLNHTMADPVSPGGSEQNCVQTLLYRNADGDAVPMPSLRFPGQDTYYYYPMPLRPGETIEIECLLFPQGPGREFRADTLRLRHEMISADNNASVLKWNVVFEDETAVPFDDSACADTPFAPYMTQFSRMIPEPPDGPERFSAPDEPADRDGDAQLPPEVEADRQIPPEHEEESPAEYRDRTAPGEGEEAVP